MVSQDAGSNSMFLNSLIFSESSNPLQVPSV